MKRTCESLLGAATVLSLCCLLPRPPLVSASADVRPAGTITSIANQGFLIEAAGRKVLVDALFEPVRDVPAPSRELLAQMVRGRAPFDGVDLVLVTHRHADHFSAGPVAAFLRNHPETTLIAHRQVLDELRNQEGFSAFQPRVREAIVAAGRIARFDLPGIRVDAVQLFHTNGGQVWNVGFSVDLGGFRFFHEGDATFQDSVRELTSFPFRQLRPVVLFFKFFDLSAESRAFVQKRIQPDHLVAMHFKFSDFATVSKNVKADLPSAILFEKSMDSRVFEAGQTPWKPDGDYLDQPLPGRMPEVFARNLVSTDNLEHSAPAFSPDGNEVFWSHFVRPRLKADRQVIMTSRRVDGVWSEPAVASFSGRRSDGGPAFSPDGRRVFFYSTSPKEGVTRNLGEDIWVVERRNDAWGEPACLNFRTRFPWLKYAIQPSVTERGHIYFVGSDGGEGVGQAIFRSAWVNGRYAQPERLGVGINSPGGGNRTPYIAPDESFLLFSSNRREPGLDWGDLWISRRGSDGRWGEPEILPESVNSNRMERFPALSPDGRFLFFTRPPGPGHSHDVYWVIAPMIESPRTGR